MTTMTKRAVLYARVSSDDRGNDGRNLAGQLDMCRDYALDRGYEPVAELSEDDRGASGAAFELEQLDHIREMARAGQFEVLVVREMDRLSRNLAKQLIVEEELKRCGVQIEYVLGEYPDTPEGRLNKHIRATIAEYEREKINERMKRGRRLKVQGGSTMFNGNPPYGYDEVQEDDGNWALVVVPDQARVVKMIFQWYVRGDGKRAPMTIAQITHGLTEMKVPTQIDLRGRTNVKKRGYGVWARGTVWNMLKNETYAGRWTYADTSLEVSVPAIINPELWKAAQARLAENKANSRRNLKHDYLLRRRVTCGKCGLKVQGKSKRSRAGSHLYFYYRCPALARTMYVRDCDLPIFRVDHVDPVVWEWVTSLLKIPERFTEGLTAYQAKLDAENEPLRERLDVVDDLLEKNQTQLQRLVDLYLSGDFPREALTERKARLEATIEALSAERKSLAASLAEWTLTAEHIASLQAFAAEAAQGLEVAQEDFKARRRIIEMLNLEATLVVEKGQKVIYVRCVLGEEVLPIVSDGSGTSRRCRSCSAA
jgi:site-specific DNA recombinase